MTPLKFILLSEFAIGHHKKQLIPNYSQCPCHIMHIFKLFSPSLFESLRNYTLTYHPHPTSPTQPNPLPPHPLNCN